MGNSELASWHFVQPQLKSLLLAALLQIGSGATLSEVEVDLELTGRRKQQQGFVEPSFPTIAGANGNGAIIHYRAQEGTCKYAKLALHIC